MSGSLSTYAAHKKAVPVVVAVLLTASVSGYFMGLRQTPVAEASGPSAAELADTNPTRVPRVASYSELSEIDYKANASWSNHLGKLARGTPALALLVNPSEAERAEALALRAQRRAYDGAPPVVPHPIDQGSSASCLACHGEGMTIKDRVASKMSHAFMPNCTQCHVPAGGTEIRLSDMSQPLARNDFVRLDSPGKGKRAYVGAPPTIPHATSMRGDCLSCHGPNGLHGLKTPHPGQMSCVQCHAPSAELDQRALLQELFPASAGKRGEP